MTPREILDTLDKLASDPETNETERIYPIESKGEGVNQVVTEFTIRGDTRVDRTETLRRLLDNLPRAGAATQKAIGETLKGSNREQIAPNSAYVKGVPNPKFEQKQASDGRLSARIHQLLGRT